jgi:hypothetical protein
MLYVLAGVLGLIVGAYACLGVIILVAPSMGSEDTLWFIYPSALAGAVLGALIIRKLKVRRQRAMNASRAARGA